MQTSTGYLEADGRLTSQRETRRQRPDDDTSNFRRPYLRNLADEALEGQLADQQLGGLLVLADLAELRRGEARRSGGDASDAGHSSEHRKVKGVTMPIRVQ